MRRKPLYERLRLALKKAGPRGLTAKQIAAKLKTKDPLRVVRDLEHHGWEVKRSDDFEDSDRRFILGPYKWGRNREFLSDHGPDPGPATSTSARGETRAEDAPPDVAGRGAGPRLVVDEAHLTEVDRQLRAGEVPPYAIRKQIPPEIRSSLRGDERFGYRCAGCQQERPAPGPCPSCGSDEIGSIAIYPPETAEIGAAA